MNNTFSTCSNTSSHMPLHVPMHEDDEIPMEGIHNTQQSQICSCNSTSNPTYTFLNDPQSQQFFDLTNRQVTSNNQILLPQNYNSQYQIQLPVIPNNDCSNQLGLHHGYHMYYPSRETSWAITQFFRSRESYYGFGNQPPRCQADGCKADLTRAKRYHRRHKVCELHSKASVVHLGGGIMQRFCQQCSRFQMLDEFDDAKKSCRRRLADHNRRRRKVKSSSLVPSSSATPLDTTEEEKQKQCNTLHLTNAAVARKEEAEQVQNSKTEDIFTTSTIHANILNQETGGLHTSNYNCKSDHGTAISVTPSDGLFKPIETS